MKWQEIYDILLHYDEENRKGWYSYTWCNRMVSISRKSQPNIIYVLNSNREDLFAEQLVPHMDGEEGKYAWVSYYPNGSSRMLLDELPEADDYFVASAVSYPYVAMLHIKEDPEVNSGQVLKNFQYRTTRVLNETKRNRMALNNMKIFINKWDYICYNKRHGGVYDEAIKADPLYDIIEDCSYAGMGANEYSGADFYFNYNEFHICTDGNIQRENKHRRHFKEQEWLFPWKSNGLERDNVLYVSSSSLLTFRGEALKRKRAQIEEGLKLILEQSSIKNYELIPIRNTYKYYPW